MPDSVFYQHDVAKLPDAGLQLNLPVDLVPAGQYSYFSNAQSRIEGQLQTRDGIVLVCTVGTDVQPIHSIFRLNQVAVGVNGERLFGIGATLWSAPLPAGNVPVQLSAYVVADAAFPAFPVNFDGTPLSIMPYRFDADPQAWAIIANGAKMMKRKASYYEQLGLPAPTAIPVVSVGAAGNLNGDYNWRYTYVNTVTDSESNPSPIETSGSVETLRPTAFTNPTPTPLGGGEQPFSNPGDAIDGGTGTFASALIENGPTPNDSSCLWNGIPAASIVYGSLSLNVDFEIIYTFNTGAGSPPVTNLEYSPDNGVTWLYLGSASGDAPRQTAIAALPVGTDLTQLAIRAWAFGFPIATHERTVEVRVYDIFTTGTPPGLADTSFTNQQAIVCVTPPTDPQESAVRLYRKGGTLTDNWYFVGQYPIASLVQGVCGVGTLEIDDNSSDADIEANPTLELDNDMPVSSVTATNVPLKAIWGFDERVLGCGDPSRAEAVYFSKRGNADEWPPENWVIVSDPGTEMMNGLSWNLRAWAFSRERLYTLVLNVIQGVTFTPQETECRRGLRGRFGFCVGEKGIYFVSKDGVYVTNGGPEASITDDSIRPLFPTFDAPGRDANGYEAIDMTDENGLRLCRHNSEIWFDYTGATSGTRQTLIYDERRNRWRAYDRDGLTTSEVQMHYSEPETVSRLLMGATVNKVFEGSALASDDSGDIEVHIRTGSRDQGQPLNLKEYGDVIFDIDPGGATDAHPVVITPYINGQLTAEAAINVTGSGRQRVALNLQQSLGNEIYALNISFDIAWETNGGAIAPILYQYDTLYRVEPAAMKHWEIPPNSLGLTGFFHVRDSYVTLRSGADVTMTLRTDAGDTQTFTIPNTAGVKQKIYVPFAANKVKLIGFTFNSTEDFRMYQPECELRAKPWMTDLGYSVAPLFGAETP